MALAEDSQLVPIFKTMPVQNEAKSQKEGRPIFEDLEIVEIRFAGDRNKISVFPAHAFSANVDRGDGTTEAQTYAERFSAQYQRFKKSKTQVKEGTPVEELPFLTQAKRSELKALNIYTAEQLSGLDGQWLKSLGQEGRELKNQAQAYLDNAAGSADSTKLASENEALRAMIRDLEAKGTAISPAEPAAVEKEDDKSPFDAFEDDDIRNWIKENGDEEVDGRLGRKKLIAKADEINASLPKAKRVA